MQSTIILCWYVSLMIIYVTSLKSKPSVEQDLAVFSSALSMLLYGFIYLIFSQKHD